MLLYILVLIEHFEPDLALLCRKMLKYIKLSANDSQVKLIYKREIFELFKSPFSLLIILKLHIVYRRISSVLHKKMAIVGRVVLMGGLNSLE